MGLVQFSQDDRSPSPGYLLGDTVCDLSGHVEDGQAAIERLATLPQLLSEGDCPSYHLDTVSLHPPTAPSTVARLVGCYDHTATDPHTTAAEFTDMATPSLWAAPTTTLTAHGATIDLPQQAETVVAGVELAAVLGRTATALDATDALDAVAGYTVCIDVAVHDDTPGLEGYKMFETFLPVGPAVVPASAIEPDAVALGVRRNGTPADNRSTTELRFSMGELVSYASRVLTLSPGDIVTTGSPVEPTGPLAEGDTVTAWVETVGTLSATVRREGER